MSIWIALFLFFGLHLIGYAIVAALFWGLDRLRRRRTTGAA